jgi:hypothetical protein
MGSRYLVFVGHNGLMWAIVGAVQKSEGVPKHKNSEQAHESHEEEGGKESPIACIRLKSCESLYTCLQALFYREKMDFYISRLPSNLENIPNVNMYTNVLYIS